MEEGPSLKEFWKEKKHIFEILGGASALGAIFLTIPELGPDSANVALEYVKLAWLGIIILGLFTLFLEVMTGLVLIEGRIKSKGFDLDGALSQILLDVLIGLLVATCMYTWFKYEGNIKSVISFPLTLSLLFLLLQNINYSFALKLKTLNINIYEKILYYTRP